MKLSLGDVYSLSRELDQPMKIFLTAAVFFRRVNWEYYCGHLSSTVCVSYLITLDSSAELKRSFGPHKTSSLWWAHPGACSQSSLSLVVLLELLSCFRRWRPLKTLFWIPECVAFLPTKTMTAQSMWLSFPDNVLLQGIYFWSGGKIWMSYMSDEVGSKPVYQKMEMFLMLER